MGLAIAGATNAVITTQSDDLAYFRQVAFHELLHLFITDDHDQAEFRDCVHDKNKNPQNDNYDSILDELLTCTDCDQKANANKLRFYNHSN